MARKLISPLWILLLVFGSRVSVFSQQDMREYQSAMDYLDNGGEVYFTFNVGEKSQLSQLANTLSLDDVQGNTVHAYANRKEFEGFLKRGFAYEVQTHPGDLLVNPAMAATPAELRLDWDKYPTYEAYVAAMYEFQTKYPALCRIVKIGKSVNGRDLLFAKISDNVDTKEAEPRHMYTSAMHGDETAMYVNFLRLIDHLLSQYNADAYVKKLVDNIEIWICPLENPDGTYQTGNATVSGARRANANNIDLNRHYPLAGQALPTNPPAKEPECQAVLKLMDTVEFVLSANTHGGSELLNYPYDYANVLHVDEKWMQYVYRQFADAVHTTGPNILTDQNNGVVRGFVWYQILGSRMDYLTYHKNMREVTFEASRTKLLPAAQFPEFWNYYHKPLLRYIEQNLFGVNGTVTSLTTGAPIKAKVRMVNHDDAQSFWYSKLPNGDFWRPIAEGTYDVEFSAQGYNTYVEKAVKVAYDKATVLNIKLTPVGAGVKPIREIRANDIHIVAAGKSVEIRFPGEAGRPSAAIHDFSGRLIKSFPQADASGPSHLTWEGRDDGGNPVPSGFYFFTLQSGGKQLARKFLFAR